MSLTQQDIDNGGLDLASLGQLVNGAPGTFLTRQGRILKTLSELEAEGNARIDALTASEAAAETAAATALAAANSVQKLDDINLSLPAKRNLVDYSRLVLRNLVRIDSGAYEDDANDAYASTGRIPCEPLTLYTTLRALYGDGVRGRAFFDAAGLFISGQGAAVAAGGTFTSPALAHSMAISLAFEADHAGQYIVKGALPAGEYRDFDFVGASGAIRESSKAQDLIRPPLFNLLQRARCVLGFATATGGYFANAPYFATGLLVVPASRTLVFNNDFVPGNSNYGWLFYDQNGALVQSCGATFDVTTHNGTANVELANLSGPVFIGMPIAAPGIPDRSYLATGPVGGGPGAYTIASAPFGGVAGAPALGTASATVAGGGGGNLANVAIRPPGVATSARISAELSQLDGATVYSRVPVANESVIGWDEVSGLHALSGRGIMSLGDSIMAGAGSGGVPTWALGVKNLTRAGFLSQAAFSGAQVDGLLTARIGGGADYSAADLVGVAATFNNVGTNNWGAVAGGAPAGTPYVRPAGSVGIGAIGDTEASNSFIGDLYHLYVDKIFAWDVANNNRDAVHLLCTVNRRYDNGTVDGNPTNTNGEKLSDYRQATIDFCNWIGMPYLDLWNVAGFDKVRGPGRFVDGLHTSGHTNQKVLAPIVARKLESLVSVL